MHMWIWLHVPLQIRLQQGRYKEERTSKWKELYSVWKFEMASITTALSWSSSLLDMGLPNVAGNIEETAKFSYGRTAMVVVAQKKASKSRKVMAHNGVSSNFSPTPFFSVAAFVFLSFYLLGVSSCNCNLVLWCVELGQIILKEDVADLGKKGQLIDVKAGYYRNYLFPMGKAQIVTPVLLK